ncbi:MAG TPA: hypothetical protein VFA66_06920 [Gaiellaceae bacterium]|nr:hypothetical protein [Gaiellaceae bacterium]
MRRAVVSVLVVASGLAGAAAAAPPARQLPESYLLSGLPSPAPRFEGKLQRLTAGAVYTSSELPVAMRITPPDASWTGAQWKSARLDRGTGGPPYFGFAAFGVGRNTASTVPHGLVVVETAYDRTPSVSATVAGLRSRGRWATYRASSPVTLAGLHGVELDGEIAPGHVHVFQPFTGAGHFVDAVYADGSELFRVVVLDVRGKTVVVYLDGVGLTADEFPAFLERAGRLLQSLRFPA